jgi:hypothetical protein
MPTFCLLVTRLLAPPYKQELRLCLQHLQIIILRGANLTFFHLFEMVSAGRKRLSNAQR